MQISIIAVSYAKQSIILNAGSFIYHLNLPLASVKNSKISYRQFVEDYSHARSSVAATEVTDEAVRQGVWGNIMREIVVGRLLLENNLSLDTSLLVEAKSKFITSIETESKQAELRQNYNLSPREAAERFIRPLLEEEQLRRWYAELPSTPERQKIESLVLEAKAAPGNFVNLAGIATSDGQDTITEHVVPEEDLKDAYDHIRNLKQSGISNIIASPDGYRLYQVKAIVLDETEKKYFQLQELFVPLTSFDSYIDEEIKNTDAEIYFPRVVSE